jgi:hypothetical protein
MPMFGENNGALKKLSNLMRGIFYAIENHPISSAFPYNNTRKLQPSSICRDKEQNKKT